ncbi:MAG: hypothetical protein AAB861_00575 [Patescibacteria group bacterium]
MAEKDTKTIKGYIDKVSKDFRNQIEGYIEHVDDKFKATSEGTMGIHEKLDRIEKTLDSHSERIANVLMDLADVKSDVRQVKMDVNFDLNRKVDKKHFVDLEGRVRVLEKV